ncbi:MAG TPA: GNAT family N-acetyltransferase [Burkholderiaceae bacterium]
MSVREVSNDYVIGVHDDPAALDAAAWNALVETQPDANPFVRYEMLLALHASGSATPRTGWSPCFVTLQRGTELVAACPAYLKTHSYGEYVFDWAWADAYERHGLPYYPKLLGAVPFTPVPGPRLLARDADARRALLQALRAIARRTELSSVHLLFVGDDDAATARDAGWLLRHSVQFHWQNRSPQAYADFDDFLATFRHDKRKKIHQERRKVHDAGVSFSIHEGAQIDDAMWSFFHRCYTLTYRAHHSTPYLTRDFFARMAATMPQHWVMFVAARDGQRIGASLVALDPLRRVAYGRYWGAIEHVPCLHFEACYYQPLAWCIANGYVRFEGGAQGEHKMARGLMPVRTSSAHWLAHPQFARAVADFLEREGAGIDEYVDELRERNPFTR